MGIDPTLQAVMDEIRQVRDDGWSGTMGENLRPWLNFAGVVEAGKFDFQGVFNIFDRKKLDDDYMKARNEPGAKSKDVWIAKLSSDLLAGFQRDYLLRTRSRIRYFAHAAARGKSDGMENGPIATNTTSLIARIDTAQEA